MAYSVTHLQHERSWEEPGKTATVFCAHWGGPLPFGGRARSTVCPSLNSRLPLPYRAPLVRSSQTRAPSSHSTDKAALWALYGLPPGRLGSTPPAPYLLPRGAPHAMHFITATNLKT
jgi:hypothetical protein